MTRPARRVHPRTAPADATIHAHANHLACDAIRMDR